jgi:protein TonB
MIEDRAEPATLAASALLTGAGVAMLLLAGSPWQHDAPSAAEQPVEIALMAEPAPPPAPAPIAPAEISRSRAVEETPLLDPPVRTQAAADLAAPRPHKHRASAQATPAASPAPSHTETVDRPAAPARPAPPAGNPSADARYTTLVHATIERDKRNPDTPLYRMMHPHGTARVVFTLDRSGAASGVHVAESSGVPMLDDQAVRIVQDCRFPTMPTEAFAGSPFHIFSVDINFPPFGATD